MLAGGEGEGAGGGDVVDVGGAVGSSGGGTVGFCDGVVECEGVGGVVAGGGELHGLALLGGGVGDVPAVVVVGDADYRGGVCQVEVDRGVEFEEELFVVFVGVVVEEGHGDGGGGLADGEVELSFGVGVVVSGGGRVALGCEYFGAVQQAGGVESFVVEAQAEHCGTLIFVHVDIGDGDDG